MNHAHLANLENREILLSCEQLFAKGTALRLGNILSKSQISPPCITARQRQFSVYRRQKRSMDRVSNRFSCSVMVIKGLRLSTTSVNSTNSDARRMPWTSGASTQRDPRSTNWTVQEPKWTLEENTMADQVTARWLSLVGRYKPGSMNTFF